MLAVAPQTTYDVPAADSDQQQLAEKVQAFIKAKWVHSRAAAWCGSCMFAAVTAAHIANVCIAPQYGGSQRHCRKRACVGLWILLRHDSEAWASC